MHFFLINNIKKHNKYIQKIHACSSEVYEGNRKIAKKIEKELSLISKKYKKNIYKICVDNSEPYERNDKIAKYLYNVIFINAKKHR